MAWAFGNAATTCIVAGFAFHDIPIDAENASCLCYHRFCRFSSRVIFLISPRLYLAFYPSRYRYNFLR